MFVIAKKMIQYKTKSFGKGPGDFYNKLSEEGLEPLDPQSITLWLRYPIDDILYEHPELRPNTFHPRRSIPIFKGLPLVNLFSKIIRDKFASNVS